MSSETMLDVAPREETSCTVLRYRRPPGDDFDRPPSTCVIYDVVKHFAAGRDDELGDAGARPASSPAAAATGSNGHDCRRGLSNAAGHQASEDGSGEDMCRICLESQTDGSRSNKLITPCWCDGSMKYVHKRCLEEWLEWKGTPSCELCGYTFAIKRTPLSFAEWMTHSLSCNFMKEAIFLGFWCSFLLLLNIMSIEPAYEGLKGTMKSEDLFPMIQLVVTATAMLHNVFLLLKCSFKLFFSVRYCCSNHTHVKLLERQVRPRERSLSPGVRGKQGPGAQHQVPSSTSAADNRLQNDTHLTADLGSNDSMHPVDQDMNSLNVRRPSTVTNPSSVDAIAGTSGVQAGDAETAGARTSNDVPPLPLDGDYFIVNPISYFFSSSAGSTAVPSAIAAGGQLPATDRTTILSSTGGDRRSDEYDRSLRRASEEQTRSTMGRLLVQEEQQQMPLGAFRRRMSARGKRAAGLMNSLNSDNSSDSTRHGISANPFEPSIVATDDQAAAEEEESPAQLMLPPPPNYFSAWTNAAAGFVTSVGGIHSHHWGPLAINPSEADMARILADVADVTSPPFPSSVASEISVLGPVGRGSRNRSEPASRRAHGDTRTPQTRSVEDGRTPIRTLVVGVDLAPEMDGVPSNSASGENLSNSNRRDFGQQHASRSTRSSRRGRSISRQASARRRSTHG